MSLPDSPLLTLDVRRRRTERYVAWLALAAVAAAVGLLNFLELRLAGAAGAVCLALAAGGLWWAGWIGSRHRIAHVAWLADGRWLLTDERRESVAGELSPDTRLGRHAVWVRWRTGAGRRRSLLLAAGDVPETQLRRLLVRLRIEAAGPAAPGALPA